MVEVAGRTEAVPVTISDRETPETMALEARVVANDGALVIEDCALAIAAKARLRAM